MQIEIKTRRELSALDRVSLEKAIHRLDRQTAKYRMCHLQVTIDGVGHSTDRDVKMVLALPRRPLLVVAERASFLGPAALHCVEALARRVQLAKPRGPPRSWCAALFHVEAVRVDRNAVNPVAPRPGGLPCSFRTCWSRSTSHRLRLPA